MQNPDFVEADIALLRKVWSSHPLIPKAGRNPVRHANEVLYALLDKSTREEIRLNRREYEQSNSKNNGNDNTGRPDTNSSGREPESNLTNESGTDNPSGDGDNNAHIEETTTYAGNLTEQLTAETEARENAEERAAEAEEHVDELASENEELLDKLEEEVQAREEIQAALEEEKKVRSLPKS